MTIAQTKRELLVAQFPSSTSGEGGIRTLGRLAPTPVFETGTIGRSVTSPANMQARRPAVFTAF